MRKISQREARRLRRRVKELSDEINSLKSAWDAPYEGVHLFDWNIDESYFKQLNVARKFGAKLVLRFDLPRQNVIRVFGVK